MTMEFLKCAKLSYGEQELKVVFSIILDRLASWIFFSMMESLYFFGETLH